MLKKTKKSKHKKYYFNKDGILENLSFYISLPKSFYKSRLDKKTNSISFEDGFPDQQARNAAYDLQDLLVKLTKNKYYSSLLEELVLLEVRPNASILDVIYDRFIYYHDNGGEPKKIDNTLKVIREIDFIKLLSMM